MELEKYFEENICSGCDQDPIQCYEKGYCIYDHDEEVEFI
jgi:hypothetical protein